MGNQISKRGWEVADSRFPLNSSPVDVQLTVHVNNLVIAYGQDALAGFKFYLNHPEKMNTSGMWVRTRDIINHYGPDKCKQWFALIYGWEYEKAG